MRLRHFICDYVPINVHRRANVPCRINFCCTAIGVPTASNHERYVCLMLCVLTCPVPANFVALR
jgi:hypothetical protein